jgi:hypothetical protein
MGRKTAADVRIMHAFTEKVYCTFMLFSKVTKHVQVIDEREQNGPKIQVGDASDYRVFEEVPKRRFALLDLLLDQKRRGVMNLTEVRQQVDTFMIAVNNIF